MTSLSNECNVLTLSTKNSKKKRKWKGCKRNIRYRVVGLRAAAAHSHIANKDNVFFLFFWRVCFLDLLPWQQQGQIRCAEDLTGTQEILPDLHLHLLYCWFLFLPDSKRAEESASRERGAHEFVNNRSLQKKTINLYCLVRARVALRCNLSLPGFSNSLPWRP